MNDIERVRQRLFLGGRETDFRLLSASEKAEYISGLSRLATESIEGFARAKQALSNGQCEIEEVSLSGGVECVARFDASEYADRCLSRYLEAIKGVEEAFDFLFDVRFFKERRAIIEDVCRDMHSRICVVKPASFCMSEKAVFDKIKEWMSWCNRLSTGEQVMRIEEQFEETEGLIDEILKKPFVPIEFQSKEAERFFKTLEEGGCVNVNGESKPILDRSELPWKFASTNLLSYIANYIIEEKITDKKWCLFERVTGIKNLQQIYQAYKGTPMGWGTVYRILLSL